MAIKLSISTGATGSGSTKWYALYFQRSTGKIADTTNSTWDTIVAGDLADYSSFLSEVSTSGVYEATVPAFVETAALTEPIDYVILATAAGTEAWTDGAIGKPRYEGTLTENANVVGISGDTTAADNAESFFDGTGYAGTNNVIPLVTTTTTATNVTTVNGLAANVITATSIASDAITAAKIADGAIDANTFATGAITAAAIAADAIGASELAADAVSEIAAAISIPSAATIADAVWDEARSGHVSAGTFGEGVIVEDINSGGIAASSFASGAITAAAIAADAIGASELAADAVSEIAAAISIPSAATIADAVWDEATSGHTTSGTFGEQVKTDIDAILDDTGTSGVIVVTNNDKTGYRLSATGVDDIWDEAQSGHATAGTFGLYLDATVSSRLATAGYTTPPTVGAIADQVWDEVRSEHSTGGTFGAGMTMANAASGSIGAGSFSSNAIDANALAADAVAEIQSGLSTLTQANIRTAVGLASANLDTQLADLPTVAEFEARTLVAANYFDPAADTVIVGTNNDKTGYALSSSGLDAVLVEASISAGAGLTNDTGTQLTSINARQALALCAAALEGVLAGAAGTTITIKPAAKPSGNTRITATVDSDGNRTALTLKVPD